MNPIHNKNYIYIAECGGNYKIGVSSLPEQRLSLIRTDNYQSVHTIVIIEMVDAYAAEKRLHDLLKEIGAHIRGEWFKFQDIDMLIDFLKAHNSHTLKSKPQPTLSEALYHSSAVPYSLPAQSAHKTVEPPHTPPV